MMMSNGVPAASTPVATRENTCPVCMQRGEASQGRGCCHCAVFPGALIRSGIAKIRLAIRAVAPQFPTTFQFSHQNTSWGRCRRNGSKDKHVDSRVPPAVAVYCLFTGVRLFCNIMSYQLGCRKQRATVSSILTHRVTNKNILCACVCVFRINNYCSLAWSASQPGDFRSMPRVHVCPAVTARLASRRHQISHGALPPPRASTQHMA